MVLRPRYWFTCTLVILLAGLYGCRGTATPESPESPSNGAHSHDHDHDHDHDDDDDDDDDHDHDHDHHGHDHAVPATFADAVTRLESLTSAITAASKAGELEKAHDELHEVGSLLDDWGALVDKYDLADPQATEAKGAGEALFSRFMQLDDVLHGGEEVDQEQLSEGLKSELGKLRAIATPAAE